ncbi:ABC transporter permease [Poseidonocella sp. HB161398]|uniref:ABC transporter permease n=1 Tax=Poseidonocella sp. HB161398 TaxID=2320855 RepID=UPI001109892C|nr:ABC transporter permease [Poseidonocella sp. HB161398]
MSFAPSQAAPSQAAPSLADRALLRRILANGGAVIALLVLTLGYTILSEPRFLSRLNLINVGRNFAFLSIPAIAQMLVMTVGGFDLSIGAVVAAGSLLTAATMGWATAAMPGAEAAAPWLSLAAVLAMGALIGLANALIVARLELSAFMVTLATGSILTGIALYLTQGIPVYGVPDGFVDRIGRGRLFGLPAVTLIALGVILLAVAVQRGTVLGRHLYAAGSDLKAARLSGVPVLPVQVAAYVAAGMLAGLTGFLMTSRIGSGQATIGGTLALETIAAAVIGGVSLRGGVARAELVAIAALFLTVIANSMNLLRIDSKFQTLALGAVLILALGFERLVLRRSA